MGHRSGIVVLAGALGACGLIAGIEDIPEGPGPNDAGPVVETGSPQEAGGASDATPTVDSGPPLPPCGAQRVVHINAGTGSLGWFQLLWPVPMVVTAPSPDYAIDDPKRFSSLGTTEHPLYVRVAGTIPLWVGSGIAPLPTVLVAGNNETHTDTSTSAITVGGKNAIAYGAGLQRTALAPRVPVVTIGSVSFGTAPGAPTPVNVPDAKGAVAAVVTAGYPEARLAPDPAVYGKWHSMAAPSKTTTLAERLLFAANAFKLGAVGTVVISALRDDPHGAFVGVDATTTANDLAGLLGGFYAELATSFEPTCGGADGKRLSLADNVMIVVNGDTPKNPFERNGWPDGTPGNSNLVYVRSNGFMKPGWFGQLTPTTRTNFDPTTGALRAAANVESSAAAVNAIVYAIARGNAAAVTAFDASPYVGVRAP